MNFHIYREIKHDNPGKPTYQQIGSTLYKEDAQAILDRWHAGYIVENNGIIIAKNCAFQ